MGGIWCIILATLVAGAVGCADESARVRVSFSSPNPVKSVTLPACFEVIDVSFEEGFIDTRCGDVKMMVRAVSPHSPLVSAARKAESRFARIERQGREYMVIEKGKELVVVARNGGLFVEVFGEYERRAVMEMLDSVEWRTAIEEASNGD